MSDMDFWTNANLHGGKLKDAVIGTKTEAASAKAGSLASEEGKLFIYSGTAWVELGSSGDLSALSTRVTALETAVGDDTLGSETGLYADIAALESSKLDKNTAITPSTTGKYFVVQYDADGLVTAGREATENDLPTISQSKVSGLDTALAGKLPTTTTINGVSYVSGSYTLTKSDLGLNYEDDADVNIIEGISFKASGASSYSDLTIDGNKKALLDLSGYALKSDLASAFNYKGTKATYSALPATGNAKGDVWNVESAFDLDGKHYPAGTNVAYTGTAWDPLGGTTTGYVPNTTTVNGQALSSNVSIGVNDLNGITDAQKNAINSGITSAKVSTYDGYATTLAGKMNALASASGGKLLVSAASDLDDIAESTIDASTAATKLGYVDTGKAITTYLSQNYVAQESGKGLSTEDYTTAEKTKLSGIATGAQVNVIETVKVNGTALSVSSKAVNVTVPTKTSDLTNDSTFQTASQVTTTLGSYYTKTAIQGYFVSDSISTVMDNELGYAVAEKTLSAVPFMAQLLDGSGNVVIADIQLDTTNNKVIVRTNAAKTGTLKVLCLPA